MAKRIKRLRFPIGGVNRRVGFQSQPPFTTFDAKNVRPDSVADGRARGGSRPGLSRLFPRFSSAADVAGTMVDVPVVDGPYSIVTANAIFTTEMAPWINYSSTTGAHDNIGVPSYDSSTGKSTLTFTAGFLGGASIVGGEVLFLTSLKSYIITDSISSSSLKVSGDASGEASGDDVFIVFVSVAFQGAIVFDASGNSYTLKARKSSTVVVLIGDASGETTGDTFVVTSGNEVPINLLGTVRESEDSGIQYFIDSFNYDSTDDPTLPEASEKWKTVTGTTGSWEITSPMVLDDALPVGLISPGVDGSGFAKRSGCALTDLIHDMTLSSTIQASCLISSGATFRDTHQLFAWMDNTTPEPFEDGIEIWTWVESQGSGAYWRQFGIVERASGSIVTSASSIIGVGSPYKDSGILSATITGQDVTVRWLSNLYSATFTHTLSGSVSTSKRRVGIGMYGDAEGVLGARTLMSQFQFSYRLSTGASYRQRLVVSSNQQVFTSDGERNISEISDYTGSGGAVTIADERVYATELGGKLYIADNEMVLLEGNGGTIVTTDTLDDSDVSDWTTYVTQYDTAVELFNHDNGGDGVYKVTAVVAGDVTLGGSPPNTAVTTDYRVYRTPKYYDPVADKLYSWFEEQIDSGLGTMPLGCPLIARYNGRIVLAGAPTARHIWYMSRQNNALDWDYSQVDVQAALAGTSTEVGIIADPITALIPYLDDYLIFSCADSMWVLRGDPKLGGRLLNQNPAVGCIGAAAWCFMSNGTLVFMGRNGLYSVAPGAFSEPQEMSATAIPNEFVRINENDDVQLAYDEEERGIHIFIKRVSGSKDIWWWDEDTRGFWPVSTSSLFFPSALYSDGVDELGRNLVILGGEDGYLRAFNTKSFDDDGVALDAYVFIGPFRGGSSEYLDGMLTQLVAVLGETSDSVSWNLYVEDTAEGVTRVASSSQFDSGTWVAGRNYHVNPRCRGGAFTLKISSTATPAGPWSMESVIAVIEGLGMQRVL